jgi:agmatine deiminase
MVEIRKSTPYEDGFIMPGRFERHRGSLISWPTKGEKETKLFRDEIVQVVEKMSKYEDIFLVVDHSDLDEAEKCCGNYAKIISAETEFAWVRDNGPMFIRNKKGELAVVKFQFNGWGDKYPTYERVKSVPSTIAKYFNVPLYEAPFILEGGAICIDGEGTLIATEQTLLNPNRNPSMSKEDIEQGLRDYLGIEKVIWLYKGFHEDTETDGHVDNVIEYISPGKVIVQTCSDKENPNFEILKENLSRLKVATDAKGRKLEIVEFDYLPYTHPIDGISYPTPYPNYYVMNGAIIVPQVGWTGEKEAVARLKEIFPNLDVVEAPSTYQAVGGGGLGCMTQQIPE